ncbi:hypothetical protein SB521682_1988 [Shigella boydii 5216-82]|nr:hypothetical protein SB521682_1988 [Shigella boydii 5216-82]
MNWKGKNKSPQNQPKYLALVLWLIYDFIHTDIRPDIRAGNFVG